MTIDQLANHANTIKSDRWCAHVLGLGLQEFRDLCATHQLETPDHRQARVQAEAWSRQQAWTFQQVDRASRIYTSNTQAAEAMGITPATFGRLCKKYGIPTAAQRHRER